MFEFITNLFLLSGALIACFFALLLWSAVILLIVWEFRGFRADYKSYRDQKKRDNDIFSEVERYRDDQ